MNEKLRQYEKESGLEIYGLGTRRIKWEAAMQKFAELIVKDCAQTVEHINMQGGGNLGDIIKQKFGVD